MSKKLMKEAIRACQRAGLVHEPQHTHPRMVNPATGKYVSFSSSPSCPHAHKHLLADVRKYLNITVTL